jgi:TRAP-type C4-dicarboxylate transport system permease small subunit
LKIFKTLADLEERLGGFLLIILFLIVLLQILARGVGWNIVWTEESSRFLFIWIIFLGVSAGIKYDTHIGTNIFVNLLPKGMYKTAAVIKDILFFLFVCYMAKLSLSLLAMQLQFKQTAPATGFPIYLISIILPIGFITTALRIMFKIKKTIRSSSIAKDNSLVQRSEAY